MHVRQAKVSHQKVKILVARGIESSLTRRGPIDTIALIRKDDLKRLSHTVFILHDKDSSPAGSISHAFHPWIHGRSSFFEEDDLKEPDWRLI
jgi:hypothetical protein